MNRIKKPHFQVAAGLIWDKGRLLITKRPVDSHLGGLWEFPGGKQEKGETLEECLEREILEELGIRVKAGECLLKVEHEYESKHVSLHFFTCTLLEHSLKPGDSDRGRWVRPSELGSFAFPPPDEEIIRLVSNGRVKEKRAGT